MIDKADEIIDQISKGIDQFLVNIKRRDKANVALRVLEKTAPTAEVQSQCIAVIAEFLNS